MGGQIARARRSTACSCSAVAAGLSTRKQRRRRSTSQRSTESDDGVARGDLGDEFSGTSSLESLGREKNIAPLTPMQARPVSSPEGEESSTGRSLSTGVPSSPTGISDSSGSPPSYRHERQQESQTAATKRRHPEAIRLGEPLCTTAPSDVNLRGRASTSPPPTPAGPSRRLRVSTPRTPIGSSAQDTRPGSWLAARLYQESTCNDEAIAQALSDSFAQEAHTPPSSAPTTPVRRRASEPSYQLERRQVLARDEALAIALALAEEEALGLTQARRRMRQGGVIMVPSHAPPPLHIDEAEPSPRSTNDAKVGEKCIACEDNVVNCCLIPCGHVILCVACARKVMPRRCPVCRVTFEQVVRTSRRTRNV